MSPSCLLGSGRAKQERPVVETRHPSRRSARVCGRTSARPPVGQVLNSFSMHQRVLRVHAESRVLPRTFAFEIPNLRWLNNPEPDRAQSLGIDIRQRRGVGRACHDEVELGDDFSKAAPSRVSSKLRPRDAARCTQQRPHMLKDRDAFFHQPSSMHRKTAASAKASAVTRECRRSAGSCSDQSRNKTGWPLCEGCLPNVPPPALSHSEGVRGRRRTSGVNHFARYSCRASLPVGEPSDTKMQADGGAENLRQELGHVCFKRPRAFVFAKKTASGFMLAARAADAEMRSL